MLALDRALLASAGERRWHAAARARGPDRASSGIGDPGETEPGDDFPVDAADELRPRRRVDGGDSHRRAARRVPARRVARRRAPRARRRGRTRARAGRADARSASRSSTERDLDTLLELILTQARRVTTSDAGSLYLVERDESGAPTRLRFALAQNHSLPALPVRVVHGADRLTRASPGYAAATGEPLVIGDVYLLPDDATYRQNRSFDETFGYRTKSMLVLPMKTHRDEIIGVLQLINRKRDARRAAHVGGDRSSARCVPFDARCVELATRARVAGRGRDRERPAVRGHRAAVRGLRHRRRHGDRIARPDDLGSLGPRRDAHRRPRRGGGPRRRRAVSRRHASRASSCASCATPACCTTSARSACASRCW